MGSVNDLTLDFSTSFTTQRGTKVNLEGLNGRPFSVHLVWTGLTGVLNATVALQGSNDGTNWATLVSKTLDSAASNHLFDTASPGFQYFSILVTKVGVTAGILNSYSFVAKGA